EEMYLFKNFDDSKVHQLFYLDKHPNNKQEAGRFPVAWCKNYAQGKVFYTSLGHREDVWENKRYQAHILGGIKWALGLEEGDASPGNL
ncbi:MAG: ThuA domain-containing protein, partial [Verrucomicrobia bacterium]